MTLVFTVCFCCSQVDRKKSVNASLEITACNYFNTVRVSMTFYESVGSVDSLWVTAQYVSVSNFECSSCDIEPFLQVHKTEYQKCECLREIQLTRPEHWITLYTGRYGQEQRPQSCHQAELVLCWFRHEVEKDSIIKAGMVLPTIDSIIKHR